MAQHGYFRDYDEGHDRDEERERGRDFMLGSRDDEERRRSGFATHPDEHYLSWREQHMRELDRDYDEYRRERAQLFHQDFDSWRRQRHGNPPPLQAGMTQTSTPGDTDGTLEPSTEAQSPAEGGQDPMATATMGTTSSGRGRR